MNLDGLERKKHTERITEWVSGGSYAVAVEVEAVFLPDRPNEPFLTPETIRYLEKIEALAAAGDIEPLRKVGRLYVQHERAASMTSP